MIRTALEEGELACVLIPQHGPWPLLLPNVCVAEILRGGTAQPRPDAPAWLLGDLEWRQQSLPLVSFDALGELGDAQGRGDRAIVVLNRSRPLPGLPFYALTAAATPRLLRLSEEDVRPGRIDVPFNSSLGIPVMVLGEEAMVPNLELLEELLGGFVVH
jgi:chemosensory pili system protein ChpC